MRLLYQVSVDYFRKINWTLLLFLILVLNVKMLIKLPVIIILLLINRRMFLEKSFYRQKFIWFYFSMIAITIFNLLINISSLSGNYFLTAAVGISFWLMCVATAFLNYCFVVNTDIRKLRTTITLFFIINAALTIGQLLFIMWDSGSANPYTFQGMYQKYFINTGDRMTGITFDVSTTNAILNSFGIIYFLYSRKIHFALLCMAALLLTTSNFANILLAVVLLMMFIFKSTRVQKSMIVVYLSLLIVFMARISPQNNRYTTETYKGIISKKKERPAVVKDNTLLTQKPDSILNADERKQKIALLFIDSLVKEIAKRIEDNSGITNRLTKPTIPKPNIHTAPFQRKRDTTVSQKKLFAFAIQKFPDFDSSQALFKTRRLPGKLKAFEQTFFYFKNHPLKVFTGSGTGNFSSKLAFRATGLQIAGSYSQKLVYISDDFYSNHLYLYLLYFSGDIGSHSLVNTPNSVYDQLIAEYGLAGLSAFIIFYIFFFLKPVRKLTYGLPILLIMLVIFGVDYWFEQLSIVILFELLMLLNIKEIQQKYE